jgi:hypothetical protein
MHSAHSFRVFHGRLSRPGERGHMPHMGQGIRAFISMTYEDLRGQINTVEQGLNMPLLDSTKEWS